MFMARMKIKCRQVSICDKMPENLGILSLNKIKSIFKMFKIVKSFVSKKRIVKLFFLNQTNLMHFIND
jgi:DUF438 domain-containing protein